MKTKFYLAAAATVALLAPLAASAFQVHEIVVGQHDSLARLAIRRFVRHRLAIAGLTWLGIRSLSWFLFASAGTPTIMAIIKGQGLVASGGGGQQQPLSLFSPGFAAQIKKEFDWVADAGERLVSAFLVPPMQVIAAALNFVTLLVSNQHFLDLPLNSIKDFKDARALAIHLGNPNLGKATP